MALASCNISYYKDAEKKGHPSLISCDLEDAEFAMSETRLAIGSAHSRIALAKQNLLQVPKVGTVP